MLGPRKGDCAMRRKLLVVLLAAMMAVMTIVGASPAFADGYYWQDGYGNWHYQGDPFGCEENPLWTGAPC